MADISMSAGGCGDCIEFCRLVLNRVLVAGFVRLVVGFDGGSVSMCCDGGAWLNTVFFHLGTLCPGLLISGVLEIAIVFL